MPLRLEDLIPDAQVTDLIGREAVRIVSVQMMGEAANVVYRDGQGNLQTQILFRDKAAKLELGAEGRKWSFQGLTSPDVVLRAVFNYFQWQPDSASLFYIALRSNITFCASMLGQAVAISSFHVFRPALCICYCWHETNANHAFYEQISRT
jgi:hypothetical protein